MKKEFSNKIQELLSSGTPKQKAALMCQNSERKHTGDSPLLTPAEERAILNSLKDGRAGAAYNKWIDLHAKIFDFTKQLCFAYNVYRGGANALLGYIRVWEDYNREADRLNQLLLFMKREAPKKVEAFIKEVLSLPFRYGKVKLEDDGYFGIDIDGDQGLYKIIETKAEDCRKQLSYFKTYIVLLEEFIKENKAEAFTPQLTEDTIPYGKEDIAQEIAPGYSKTLLLKRKAKGERITPEEEKRAVFPDYETTETDPDIEAAVRPILYGE